MKSIIRNTVILVSCGLLLLAYNNCGINGGFESGGFESSGYNDNEFEFDSSEASPPGNRPSDNTPLPVGSSSFSSNQKLGGNQSSPFRMLTEKEVQNSLEDIFSISLDEIVTQKLLPDFSEEMFSNFQENINVSRVHVDGLKRIATLVNNKTSDAQLKKMMPCLGSSINDSCINSSISHLVFNIFRKKIDSELSGKYTQFLKGYKNDGYKGVRLLINALIQSPSFILRQEVGTKSAASYNLNSFEIASRLSYFITGSRPDKTLIDLALNNQLDKAGVRQEQVRRLLNTQKARNNLIRINKQIFRMDKLNVNRNLASLFTQESEQLFNDIIFKNNKPWTHVFTAEGSYLNKELATHYGLSATANNFTWTPYAGKRQGILSHGSFLSYLYTGNDEATSPIKRGLQIVEDLLCKHLPAPSDVDIDDDPAAGLTNECKIEARKLTTLHPAGSCFGCHTFMEPLGLSLERFNMLGQYRSSEKNRPQCSTIEPGLIDGQSFNSMQELGSIMASHQDINLCLTKRVLSYAFGNFIKNEHVMAYNQDLENFNNDKTFISLITDIVTSPQFIRRDL